MKAAIFDTLGLPEDVLQIKEIPLPEPEPSGILFILDSINQHR